MTNGSTEWQIKDGGSVGKAKRRWRDDIVGQQGTAWTRMAKDRKLEDFGRGLLPAVE